jgi:hypothetical protein
MTSPLPTRRTTAPPARGPGRPLRYAVAGLAVASLAACVQVPPRYVAPPPPSPVARPAMYFYPNQGQSEMRQDRDRFECYQWAKAQTGTDPGMTPIRGPAPEPVEPPVTGAGAAVGAVTGAAIGAATSGRRGSGEAVVLGAIIGTILGAAAESANAQAEAQSRAYDYRSRPSQAAALRQVDAFRRAMGACMSSRGYTVG